MDKTCPVLKLWPRWPSGLQFKWLKEAFPSDQKCQTELFAKNSRELLLNFLGNLYPVHTNVLNMFESGLTKQG